MSSDGRCFPLDKLGKMGELSSKFKAADSVFLSRIESDDPNAGNSRLWLSSSNVDVAT